MDLFSPSHLNPGEENFLQRLQSLLLFPKGGQRGTVTGTIVEWVRSLYDKQSFL